MENEKKIDDVPIKMVIVHGYVSHNQMVAIENGPVEIVNLPIINGDFPYKFLKKTPGELRLARALLGSPALDGGHPGEFTRGRWPLTIKKGWV
jgi:hypothetical protein